MKTWSAAFLAVVAVALVAACASDDDAGLAVTGSVTAPDSPDVALASGATLTVALQDVSRADAAAVVLSSSTVEVTGFPVAFELPYDLGDIADSSTYAVSARVESNGDLLMVSDTFTPVITGGAPTTGVELAVVLIASN